MICVDREQRGKGLAELLLTAFINSCIEKGYDNLHLKVAAENARAIAFYRKLGWQTVSRNSESVSMSFEVLSGRCVCRTQESSG